MLHASEDDTEFIGRVNFRKIHCLPFSLKATPSGLQPLNVVIFSAVRKMFYFSWNTAISSFKLLSVENSARCTMIRRTVHSVCLASLTDKGVCLLVSHT